MSERDAKALRRAFRVVDENFQSVRRALEASRWIMAEMAERIEELEEYVAEDSGRNHGSSDGVGGSGPLGG